MKFLVKDLSATKSDEEPERDQEGRFPSYFYSVMIN